jgi:hypothetical protein
MVMELLEGWTLGDLIHYRAPLAPGLVIHIGGQICAALEAAEKVRLVHRDLKPDNILLSATDDGFWAKVLDFGIARIARGDDDSALKRQESTVEIAGTPAYMAPEQVLGREPAPSSDLYSLGVILFEMLTRRRPFDEDSSVALCMRQMNEDPPDVAALVKVSEPLGKLVMQLLSRRPEDRPPSASDVRARLEACPEARMPFSRPSLAHDAPRGLASKTTRSEFGGAMTEKTMELKYLQRPHPPLADVLARNSHKGGIALVMPERKEAHPPSPVPPPLPARGDHAAVLAILAEQARTLESGPVARFLESLEQRGAEVLREEKTAVVRIRSTEREGAAVKAVRALAGPALQLQAEALRHNAALRIGIAPVSGPRLVQAVDEARRLAADTVHGKVAMAMIIAKAAGLAHVMQTGVFLPDGTTLDAVVLRDERAPVDDEAILWGRSIQLRRLGQIADEAVRNGPAQAVVTGHRGLGKTSCLQHFLRGRRALAIRVSPLSAGFPGHAVARLVAATCGIPRITGRAADLDNLSQLQLSERERELVEALILDRPLLSAATSANWARLVFELLVRHAERDALVVALDDAHHLDTASALILAEVMQLAAGQPWLFVATARANLPDGFMAQAHRVELKPLGLRPMNQLAEELRLDHRKRHTLLALAQGNPAVLRLLAAPDAPADPPLSLGEGLLPWLLNKVIRRAGPTEVDRAWLEAASGQGRAFETPLVEATRYFVDSGLTPELRDWLAKRLTHEGPVLEALGRVLGGTHQVEAIARQERLGLHRLAASELERRGAGANVATPIDALTLARLRLRAADRDGAARALRAALGAAQDAQALPAATLVELAREFLALDDASSAALALGAARHAGVEQADPFVLGEYFVLHARVSLGEQGVKAAAACLPHAQRCQELLARGDARRAMALAALIQEVRAEIAIAADDVESARTNLRQARQILRDIGHEPEALRCLVALGAVDANSDDPKDLKRSVETLQVASRLALAAGLAREHLNAELLLGEAEVALGELDPGTQRLRVAFRSAQAEAGDLDLQCRAALAMAFAMVRRGLTADARRYLDRARQLGGSALQRARLTYLDGLVAIGEGQGRRAARHFTDAAELFRQAGHGVRAAMCNRAASHGEGLAATA